MVLHINKKAFFKIYFAKATYTCGMNLKKHILADSEQIENEIQPSYAASNNPTPWNMRKPNEMS